MTADNSSSVALDGPEAVEGYEEGERQSSEHDQRLASSKPAADAQSTASSIPPDGGTWGWLRVLAAWLLLIAAWGPTQTFGTFQAFYSVSFLASKSASDISWIGGVSNLLLITSGAFAGPLFDRGYLKPMMCLGCFLEILGMMMLSLSTTYVQIFLSQGVCLGLGSGLIFVPALAFVVNSFQTNRAIAVGFTTTGTSIGGVVFPIMFRRLQPVIGFGWTCRVFGFLQLGVSGVGLCILLLAPVRKTKPRKLFELDAFRSPAFCIFFVSSFCSFLAYWIPIFYIPQYAISVLGASPDLGSYFTVILNGASAVGRVLPALIMKRYGAGPVTSACTGLGALLLFVWIGVSSLKGFIAWCVFFGLFTGVLVSGFPMLVSHPIVSPDMRVIGTRIGMIYFAGGLGALVGNPIAGVLAHPERRDFTSAQAFAGAIMTACAVGLTCVTILARRHDQRQKGDAEKNDEEL